MKRFTVPVLALALLPLYSQQSEPPIKRSNITIYNVNDKSTKVIYKADRLIEAPNWSADGDYLLVNSGGDLWTLPVSQHADFELN